MTTDTTRAVLDAAIDKFARAAIDDANALGAPDEFAAAKAAWAAIAPAITAHVEAEVARRLAVAPSVDDALAAYGTAVYELGYVLHRPDRDAVLRPVKDASESTLRAAIAADRERAVAEATRPATMAHAPRSGYYTYAVRVVITDGISVTRETDVSGMWTPELESFAGRMLIDLARPITDAERAAPPATRATRPTPDAPTPPGAAALASAWRNQADVQRMADAISGPNIPTFVCGTAERRTLIRCASELDALVARTTADKAHPVTDVVDPVLFAIGSCHDGSDLWAHMKRDPEAFRRTVSRVLSGKIKPMPSPDEAGGMTPLFLYTSPSPRD